MALRTDGMVEKPTDSSQPIQSAISAVSLPEDANHTANPLYLEPKVEAAAESDLPTEPVEPPTTRKLALTKDTTPEDEIFSNIYQGYTNQQMSFGSMLSRLKNEPLELWKRFADTQLKLDIKTLDHINVVKTLIAIARDSSWPQYGVGIFGTKTPSGIAKIKELDSVSTPLTKLNEVIQERYKHTLKRRKNVTRDFYELVTFVADILPKAKHPAEDLNAIQQIAIQAFCNLYAFSFNTHFRRDDSAPRPNAPSH